MKGLKMRERKETRKMGRSEKGERVKSGRMEHKEEGREEKGD